MKKISLKNHDIYSVYQFETVENMDSAHTIYYFKLCRIFSFFLKFKCLNWHYLNAYSFDTLHKTDWAKYNIWTFMLRCIVAVDLFSRNQVNNLCGFSFSQTHFIYFIHFHFDTQILQTFHAIIYWYRYAQYEQQLIVLLKFCIILSETILNYKLNLTSFGTNLNVK